MNRLILALAAVALFIGAAYIKGRDDGAALAEAEFDRHTLTLERLVRAKERNMQDAADKAAREYGAQEAIRAANLAVTAGELDRLRADLAAIGRGDTATPSSPDAARVAGILGQCADRLVYYAREADSLAAAVNGWQEWYGVVAPSE